MMTLPGDPGAGTVTGVSGGRAKFFVGPLMSLARQVSVPTDHDRVTR